MLGVTFQQIQKYETGFNRVSASRLWELKKALGVSVGYFFDEDEGASNSAALTGANATLADIRFMQHYLSLPQKVRRKAREFIKAMHESYGYEGG